ncbi:lymphocyte antigen 6A-2/6E-1-like [Apodemus sylvaticus]|uniref:lymphocyte antigen 6A-2/6E-1-like n=1 Tax=Apodemus sylvaticus TaxID=10129 RepID=UPI002244ED08|nr:lymphocyte antigen 6A-2/6E-1-like [Apodemus sylvaticus]XP_052016214.1 lymphocyte antigen 6A-2/6E-1-like [Apodemus sylvaticus]XP_052016215.1 lymphocyte antigen 6A-2/6E-1-like [Apodemus sylvaticus]
MDSSHATKSCVLILLVALLCAERAQGLECYNCKEVPVGASCPSVTCPYTGGFCIYQEVEVIVDSHRSKVKNSLCLPFCPPNVQSPEYLGTTFKTNTSCCQEDLCNATVPTGGSTWTMAGVLLFSLGSILLQTLL